MKISKVRCAGDEYARGNYHVALALYKQLAEQFGEKIFQTNIRMCEGRLTKSGRRDCSKLPLKEIKVACVMDEFTFHSFEPECSLFALTPDNAIKELESFNPDLLFIESAWRGKDELWSRKVGTLSQELKNVLQWCKQRHVPTVFWNKEDPVHFETFLTTAQQFDHVYTTDIDCIARYKAALGHERVYLLPFACQPKIHNPIELYERKDAFCFAGAYYVRYPERTRDLENYVAEFPKYKPLEIYDRNFGKDDVNYQFPEAYQPYIVGTLPFNEIDKAYKGYRYSINLNSIKQSQTMFARRVFELLGSNTITVSNFSRGGRLLFGDLVIASDSGKEIIDRLQRMDAEGERKLQLAGMRKVMREHTYGQRLAYVARKALGWELGEQLPLITVVAQASSKEDYQHVLANYLAQSYVNKQLVLVKEGEWQEEKVETAESVTILTLNHAADTLLADLVDEGSWFATMLPHDYFGSNYLLDLALATRYSEASVVGKGEYYQWTDAGLVMSGEGLSYRPASCLPVRASMLRSDSVPKEKTLKDWLASAAEATSQGGRMLATDVFNYCRDGWFANDLNTVERRTSDLRLDTGLSITELLSAAESIAPAEFDESSLPKWNATKLHKLLGGLKHALVSADHVNAESLCIKSALPDGQHVYFYSREDLPLVALPARGALETYMESTPGLNIQYVFVFLDHEKKKIGHVIYSANRNQTGNIPAEAAFVRFGIRIYGSGETSIKQLDWGHRKLESAKLLGRSNTLLLTNHYPSYGDLYRNGFVHSRVKAYLEHGVVVDVFRLRSEESTQYHEFQNVDVVTGSAEALRKMLDSGRYKTVLVHFLSPEMWEVLRDYENLRVIVWIHGAEIQPWHRRDYNYQTEQEKAKAIRESDQRMAFWRTLLEPMPSNLKLVFVSRYCAETVFEDLGFSLPSDSYTVIHNPINTELFSYIPKPVEQRKRVLSIRPFASRTYANDLSVKAILEISKSACFDDMRFHIIGDGILFDETLEQLRGFANVIIERRFLTQHEIADMHKKYGVFLVPTRMDTQGVSRDEAMASGLVPVTNAVAAIPEFVDSKCGILSAKDDAIGLANGICQLYDSPELFADMSRQAAARVELQSGQQNIVAKELALLA